MAYSQYMQRGQIGRLFGLIFLLTSLSIPTVFANNFFPPLADKLGGQTQSQTQDNKGVVPASGITPLTPMDPASPSLDAPGFLSVELSWKDQFKDAKKPKIPAVNANLRLDVTAGAPNSTLRIGTVEVTDPGWRSLFVEKPTASWDPIAKQVRVKLEPRICEWEVTFPRNVTASSIPVAPKLDKFEYDIDGNLGSWKAVPKLAYVEKISAKGLKLDFLPAGFESELAPRRVRIVVNGFRELILSLDTSPTLEALTLQLPRQIPVIPKEIVTKYPNLVNEWRYVSVPQYLTSKKLWTAPAQHEDTRPFYFLVLPGFVPFYALTEDKSGKIFLWNERGNNDYAFEWPQDRKSGAEMRVWFKPPTDKRFTYPTDLQITSGHIGVMMGDKIIARRPIIYHEREKHFVSEPPFDLAELYNNAAGTAEGKKSTSACFQELETNAKLVFLFKDNDQPVYTLDWTNFQVGDWKGSKAEHSNFGLYPKLYVYRVNHIPDHDHSSVGKPREMAHSWGNWSLVDATVVINPPTATPLPHLSRISVKSRNKEEWSLLKKDEHYIIFEDKGIKKVVFIPAMLASFDLSTRIRIELEGGDSGEVELRPGLEVELALRIPGLRLKLPVGLTAKPKLLITSTKGTISTVNEIPLDVKPEIALQNDVLGEWSGAYAELRMPGYKPIIVTKLTSGFVLDASKAEKAPDKPLIVVVNNWAEIITPNDNIKTNINEVQKLACRSLVKSATDGGVTVAGFALVDEKDGKWPKGLEKPAFLYTGKDPPLTTDQRRPGNAPEDVWKHLRIMLMDPEVARQHEKIMVIIVTPFQRLLKGDADQQDRNWLIKRMRDDGLTIRTLVLGGLEAGLVPDLDKVYLNPTLLKISQTGLHYDPKKNEAEEVEKLPKWLKDEILKNVLGP